MATTFMWNFIHSKENWERYDQKCILVFMYSTRYSCQTLMKIEYSRQIFEQYTNIKFHENPSSGSRIVSRRETNGRTDMATLIGAFRNFANKPKNISIY